MMDRIYRTFDGSGSEVVHCASGMTVYEEKLIGGKLLMRYLNACGQIIPEMHLPDARFSELAHSTFRIEADGRELADGWVSEGGAPAGGDTFALTLRHTDAALRVTVFTKADGKGWISRWLRLENTADAALPLTNVLPFAGRLWRHVFQNANLSYSPAECGVLPQEQYEIGYGACSDWGTEGDFGFHTLTERLHDNGGMNGRSGWSRPEFVLRDCVNGQQFCCEFAYSGNWQLLAEPCSLPDGAAVDFAIGLAAPAGECVRVLAPGESVLTPQVHFTLCAEGAHALVASRHRFVREQILPQSDPIGRCLIEANHRGYLCDRENEADILRDIDVAAAIGAELYVIDAGWFGKAPNNWYNNAGDWFAGQWLPNDLYPIIRHAKERGMKFGLWMEIEAAGENSAVRKEHPEFLMRRHGELCCGGRALDYSKPEVIAWVEEEIARVITRYDLDMFRIDHNHWLNESGTREVCGYTENVLWRYFENFYALFARLRARFPNVSFQNCAAGGGRLDLGILRYFHHTEVTDWVRPPRSAKIFNGILAQLPPEIQLRTVGTEVSEHVQDSDILAQLHNVMQSRMIFRGIAPLEQALAPQLKERLVRATALYKTELRPILTGSCRVYRHAEQSGVLTPCGWSANEFARPDSSAAFAVVQKLSDTAENWYRLRFLGLKSLKTYQVRFDRREDELIATGAELLQTGLLIPMDGMLTSELILVKELGS